MTGIRISEYHCTMAPHHPPFVEQHAGFEIAVVQRGVFCYETGGRTAVLGPGAVLLGSPGREYRCFHEYGTGDVCTVLHFETRAMAGLCADLGRDLAEFPVPSLPPTAGVDALHRLIREHPEADDLAWALGARVIAAVWGSRPALPGRRADRDRVWDAVQRIEADPAEDVALDDLARGVDLSPFHFLRLFRRETGATPHQYRVQARLRRAVALLRETAAPVTDVAYAVGFGDLSNFVRTFHREVGCPPQAFRRGDRKILQAAAHRIS